MRLFFKLLTTFSVFTLLMFATSCSDNQVEPLFEESVNERTKTLKDKYVNILTTAENGWIGYYSPNENTGFFITLLNFNDNGVVDIASDYESGTLNNSVTYAINKSLKIELVFESASVFSSIFEINNNNNAGEFVFNILSATEDEVILESKLDFGDDVTILRLRKALISELDLEPIYASVNNIAHDETKSVFRNILLNDKPIATFNFNSSTRFATITYIKDGELIEEVTQIIITVSGFEFVEPLDINGAILTSFSYDEVSDAYVNTDDGLKIIYDNIPLFNSNGIDDIQALTSNSILFIWWPGSHGANPLNSRGYQAILDEVNQNCITDLGLEVVINYVEFTFDFDDDQSPCQGQLRVIDENGFAFTFCFSPSTNIVDNKLFLDYEGPGNPNGAFIENQAQPLIDFYTSVAGIFVTTEGSYTSSLNGQSFNFTNTAATMTSLDNPTARIYGYLCCAN